MSRVMPDHGPATRGHPVAAPPLRRAPELRVDRVACTGHGICASLLPRQLHLDEWGYPVVDDARVSAADGATAIRFCPARALYWSQA